MDAAENSYFLDAENAAEMARLIKQGRLMTASTGLLPEALTGNGLSRCVLDIACGPGEWALSVAERYPDWEVWGIDISSLMIDYANYCATDAGRTNARFQVMDARKQLLFQDNTFDLVHARFIGSFLIAETWSSMLSEAARVSKGGGIFVLTEADALGETTSAALARLNHLMVAFMRMGGHAFAPEGDYLGTTVVARDLLTQAGWTAIEQTADLVQVSAGTPHHRAAMEDWKTLLHLLQPGLIATGLATELELTRLADQLARELEAPDFRALAVAVTTWGVRPEKGAESAGDEGRTEAH